MSGTNSRQVLSALQGLRGIAALLVVADHTHANYLAISTTQTGSGEPQTWLLGSLGVATFFVISGFIMVHIHGRDFGQPGARKDFFARRIARIVPFYGLMTLIYVARLHLTGRMPEWADIGRSLLFIPYQNSHEPYGHPVLGQGWTLNYEALFYLVFGLALFARRGLALVFAVMLGLFALGRLGAFPPDTWLGYWSQSDILFFLAGVAIGAIRPWLKTGPDFPAALGLALACVAAGVVAGFLWGETVPVHVLMAPAAISATAACGWAFEQHRPSLLRSAAEQIGNATFAIYLSHTFVIGPVAKIAAHVPNLSPWLFIPVVFVASTAFGIAVHRLIAAALDRSLATPFPLPPPLGSHYGRTRTLILLHAGARPVALRPMLLALLLVLLLVLGLVPARLDAKVPPRTPRPVLTRY